MKRIATIAFISGVMGMAGFLGLACSMEKLEETPKEVTVEQKEVNAVTENQPEVSPETDGSDILKEAESQADTASETKMPSQEYVRLSWEASSQMDLKRIDELVSQCVAHYGVEAKIQQSELMDFPKRGEEGKYQQLNDVATCLFIKAEAVMNFGNKEEAIKLFEDLIKEYPFAQAWDPRGWFWSVAGKKPGQY